MTHSDRTCRPHVRLFYHSRIFVVFLLGSLMRDPPDAPCHQVREEHGGGDVGDLETETDMIGWVMT